MKVINRNCQENGITLIALVVTIVVLLILAAVSIGMLTGENGLITRAQDAAEETRGASVEEERDLWKANQALDEYTSASSGENVDRFKASIFSYSSCSKYPLLSIKSNIFLESL